MTNIYTMCRDNLLIILNNLDIKSLVRFGITSKCLGKSALELYNKKVYATKVLQRFARKYRLRDLQIDEIDDADVDGISSIFTKKTHIRYFMRHYPIKSMYRNAVLACEKCPDDVSRKKVQEYMHYTLLDKGEEDNIAYTTQTRSSNEKGITYYYKTKYTKETFTKRHYREILKIMSAEDIDYVGW